MKLLVTWTGTKIQFGKTNFIALGSYTPDERNVYLVHATWYDSIKTTTII